jgi:hypothetical protein
MEHICQYTASNIEPLILGDGSLQDEPVDAGPIAEQRPIRVLVCRLEARPTVEFLCADERGSHLASMQQIVGGLVQPVSLEGGLDLWCNEEGAHLPLHRVIPAVAPPLPAGYEDCEIIMLGDDLALPGQPGEWRIRGDFFLARCTSDGELADVTDADIAHYSHLWREPVFRPSTVLAKR